MSKRLNKRQQRELEELEQLKAVQAQAVQKEGEAEGAGELDEVSEDEERQETASDGKAAPVNAFAALGSGQDEPEVDTEEEEEQPVISAPKKSKKKKNKKKKSAAATPAVKEDDEDADPSAPSTSTPSAKNAAAAGRSKKGVKASEADEDGMDEVDRALAELDLKYGKDAAGSSSASAAATAASSSSTLGFRQLLSVDPKNLDADAELRRFFGSKVVSDCFLPNAQSPQPETSSRAVQISATASSSSKSHRSATSSKLRYTISKPKPTYPPATSLAGLGMRELSPEEVEDIYAGRMLDWKDPAEKWFSFEHSGVWREITRQFLGAVQSHDPNQLMALLQVYPWHVDTLMQMSEVYRLQSDIGAASDYAERALYALDRCLVPAFNVSSGACRLDFNRVENRPMFMALHRIISYLGRRGCWVTAFNFAKLLFSLDPINDPHGAAFWLDFLAIKSGNYAWIISMFEEQGEQHPAAVFQGYPGMGFAYALACRAREDAQKSKDRIRSDHALREAILAFPQAVIPLADKIGANVPNAARTHPLMQIQAGYSEDPTCTIHLLSHIYASRSEALWKEPPILSWFEQSIAANLSDLDRPDAIASREDVIRLLQTPRDPFDEQVNVPLYICRHVLCSESTSFVGFLPSMITNRSFNAYDPVPPLTATSAYNNGYFAGLQPTRRSAGGSVGGRGGRRVAEAAEAGLMGGFIERILAAVDANPAGWREELRNGWRQAIRQGQGRLREQMPEMNEDEALQQMMDVAEQIVEDRGREGQEEGGGEGGGGGGMPGAFPGA